MYDREKAVEYAHRWAFSRNPRYFDFEYLGGDCTNFASQVIYAGCGVMNYTPTFGWYYIELNRRAPAWTGVNQLYKFLVNNRGVGPRGEVIRLDQVLPGDIVQLKFGDIGTEFDHSPVVVDSGDGTPDTILIAAHTNDSDYRPLSTYSYSQLRPIRISCQWFYYWLILELLYNYFITDFKIEVNDV